MIELSTFIMFAKWFEAAMEKYETETITSHNCVPKLKKFFLSQMNEIIFLISFLNWGPFVKRNFCLICQRMFLLSTWMEIANNFLENVVITIQKWNFVELTQRTLLRNTPGKISSEIRETRKFVRKSVKFSTQHVFRREINHTSTSL